jgi:hypothetical protein
MMFPMKTINRMALGTISSFLLSAGLDRAAQKLDPLTQSLSLQDFSSEASEAPAHTCTAPCMFES